MEIFKEKDKAELLEKFDEIAPVIRVVKYFDPGFYNEMKEKLFPSEKTLFITTGRAHGKTATLGEFTFAEHNDHISFMKSGTGVAVGKRGPESMSRASLIKDVIFNDPATIVYWNDGSKTVVKCQPGDTFSEELGLAMAIAKKFLGNKGNFNDVFKSFLTKSNEKGAN